ncbi:MAG: helix-turn-helix domain-containing protein [Bacteroidales bacterium]|nr:helix-turn-helix domain-containing protein [Bacteroidales bacterium]
MFDSTKIEKIRKLKKISQTELAKNIGMTRTGYRNALKNNEFKASVLEKIAIELNTSITNFYVSDNKNYQVVKEEDSVLYGAKSYRNTDNIDFLKQKIGFLEKEIIHLQTIIEKQERYIKLLEKNNNTDES